MLIPLNRIWAGRGCAEGYVGIIPSLDGLLLINIKLMRA